MDTDELQRAQEALFVSAGADLRPLANAAWELERAVLEGQRYVAVNLSSVTSVATRSEMGDTLKWWVSLVSTSSNPERFRLLAKAALALAAQKAPWTDPQARGRRISKHPPADATYRRCVRVLSMVHELHKAGRQRIRILPMLSPSGAYWRGVITFADNVGADGFNILNWDLGSREGLVAHYTSGAENEFFGWKDAKECSARELAELFLERFPTIADRGVGSDWAYAGWLTDVLGEAEAGPDGGGLIHLIQDWEPEPEYLRRWQPPTADPIHGGSDGS